MSAFSFNPIKLGPWSEVAFLESKPEIKLHEVNPSSLEGMTQAEQVEKLSLYLGNMDRLRYDNWEHLSVDERIETLQEVENEAAKLGERKPLKITAVDYGDEGQIITNGQMDWDNGRININIRLLEQNSMQGLGQVTETVIHEGRHAYQWSNLFVRRVEPSNEKFESWEMNLKTGYQTCERFGFQRYAMQPLELDARVFAEEVRSNISFR